MPAVMMSQVLDLVRKEAHEALLKNAVDCTYYVAQGQVMMRDLAAKYGVSEKDVAVELAYASTDIVRAIKGIKIKRRS